MASRRGRSRSYSRSPSVSRSRSRSRSRHREKRNKPRWFQHDNRVKNDDEGIDNDDKDKLKWWHEIAKQKSDNQCNNNLYNNNCSNNNNKKSETKMSSTQIVNDCILNNAIFNRRMDAMQRRYAENKLIEMGINPFLNKNVVLMTDHLNPNNCDYNKNNKNNIKYNHKYSSLFKSKSKSKTQIDDELDFSLHPDINNIHIKENEENEKKEKKEDNVNKADYKNWLTVNSKNNENVNSSLSLFDSVFNENEDDQETE